MTVARSRRVALVSLLALASPLMGQQVITADMSVERDTRAAIALLNRPITVRIDGLSLSRSIDSVAAVSRVHVVYRLDLVSRYASAVRVHAQDIPLGVVLDHMLANTTLKVIPVEEGRIAIVQNAAGGDEQIISGSITGTVTDANTKRPIAGASVLVNGMGRSVITDDAGRFRIANVSDGAHQLSVRMVGYIKRTQAVDVLDGTSVVADVALAPSTNQLDQVVVTGTVVQTQLKAVPSAITVITAKEIERRGITRVDQLFRGDVPGVFAPNLGTASPLDSVTVFSRGATQLEFALADPTHVPSPPTNPMKTYVDGIELANASYLSQIDPKSIERIEILTGPQASTIYGSNAINGVMQIFTKRGTSARPQLTATLQSGWIQNNFNSALAPQQDDAVQVSGTEGRWSYNVGGSWNYMSPWSPAKQTTRMDGYGGAHFQAGSWTGDATLRLGNTRNQQTGLQQQRFSAGNETGVLKVSGLSGLAPEVYTLTGQTLGLTLQYAPFSWWSHDFVMGSDVSNTESRYITPAYTNATDTLLWITQGANRRNSIRYASTARIPVSTRAQLVLTAGADGWQNLLTSLQIETTSLTGTLNSSYTTLTRQPGHNTGGFVQGQLGVSDALFLTYGLRAEWNPTYGDAAQPNYAPRYGIAYSRDLDTPFGQLSTKLRASYGRSTRPPTASQKLATPDGSSRVQYYGPFDFGLANPDLGPESQQGGEGGIELYFGSRGSLIVTRYNQTVNNLIANVPKVDSVRTLQPLPTPTPSGVWSSIDADGYGYWEQGQNLNAGSIRNQGWEFQGTLNTGPLTTKVTYSWTKSRVLGITPRYRALLTANSFQPGAPVDYMPEHTYALGITYGHDANTLALNVTGNGQLYVQRGELYVLPMYARLTASKPRAIVPSGFRTIGPGYATADLNASHRFSSTVEGILQVQDLTDYYRNDFSIEYANAGRQTKAGLRIRL